MGKWIGVIIIILGLLAGCVDQKAGVKEAPEKTFLYEEKQAPDEKAEEAFDEDASEIERLVDELNLRIKEVKAKDYVESYDFGEYVQGIKTRLKTDQKVIALTLDACGGENGSGYDQTLIDFLIQENIKANLFVNARWIDAQPEIFRQLSTNPLFTIQNHGTEHRPLSTQPRSAWGINSTSTKEEIVEEIAVNQKKILELTGTLPSFFRSGTAFYDEVSVKIAEDLGVQVVNFDVIGDGGATFTKEQVKSSMLQASPGSIIILHMNQPESETAEGVKEGIFELLEHGYSFAHIDEFDLE